MAINLRNQAQIAKIREAGRLVAETHAMIREYIVPGATTIELDRIVEGYLREHNATSPFKGYKGFPASTCISLNDVICHGIPDGTALREGDIISIDIGANLDGWHGDSCVSYGVGAIDPISQKLLDVTKRAMELGIAEARDGNRLGDIGAAIQEYVEANGFSVVREYTGHGIGRSMHEAPTVLHYGKRGTGLKLRAGMVLTVEPMVNAGLPDTRQMRDGWTVKTVDGSRSAQFEHEIAITEAGPELMTVL
ncbi:MAG TPA: type I methionyl aminopeptidase [Herpetosiphonaceae bacterium]